MLVIMRVSEQRNGEIARKTEGFENRKLEEY